MLVAKTKTRSFNHNILQIHEKTTARIWAFLALFTAAVLTAEVAVAQTATFDHLRCYRGNARSRISAQLDLAPLQAPPFSAASGCRVKLSATQFCAPVAKTVTDPGTADTESVAGQPLVNGYVCYKLKCPADAAVPASLNLTDQFGPHALSKFRTSRLCVPTASMASCGDGITDQGEECDDGAANSDSEPDACRADCTASRCGDAVIDSGEQCDGGGGLTCGSACDPSCMITTPSTQEVTILPNAGAGASATATWLETGWVGLGHGAGDWPEGMGLTYCASCQSSNAPFGECALVEPKIGQGRCKDDPAVACDVIDGPDPANCGGGTCRYPLGPPRAIVAGGTPYCVQTRIVGATSGAMHAEDGDLELSVPTRSVISIGGSADKPCPVCLADGTANDGNRDGTCDGGDRDGLACDANGTDVAFGRTSLDCPPSPLRNVTGVGLAQSQTLTSGSVSLAATLPCGFQSAPESCPCLVCTGASDIACSSDSDCAGVEAICEQAPNLGCTGNADCSAADVGPCMLSIGRCTNQLSRACASDVDCTGADVGDCVSSTCSSVGNGTTARANSCVGSCIDQGGGAGLCDGAGPIDSFCDGAMRGNGNGYIHCATNADCAIVSVGFDAGECTLQSSRACFLDPIAATGAPDTSSPVVVGVGCIAPTGSAGLNAILGLPGPERRTVEVDLVRNF